jgi:hypothetical protein
MIVCTPQVALGAYEIAHDPGNRAGWVALTAWSGLLLTHGVVSIALHAAHKTPDEPVTPPPPPLPPPPPQPPPYYYNDPARPVPGGATPPPPEKPPLVVPSDALPGVPPAQGPTPPRPPSPRLHADFAPGPITDGYRVVPGITVFGTF